MDAAADDYIPWRERAFVSVGEAALILSRSRTWVRNRIVDRSLETVLVDGDGPSAITVPSVMALIDRIRAPRHETSKPRPRSRLHLIIDNTH